MAEGSQGPPDGLYTLADRLDDDIRMVEALIGRPFDDLVRHSPTAIAATGALVERLDDTSADLHRRMEVLRERLAAALERRQAQMRFTREGIEATLDRLGTHRPASARRRWLVELAAALAASELDAARLLLEHPAGFGIGQRAAIVTLADSVQVGDGDVIHRIIDRLHEVLTDDILTRDGIGSDLAVASARAYLDRGDNARARRVLEEAAATSGDPAVHAELAFLLLRISDAGAANAAARAANLGPESPPAFLAQAAVAEQAGEYADADEMYRQAVRRLDLARVEEPQRGSLLIASGILHLRRGERLEETGLLRAALQAYRSAVSVGISGPGLYADAAAYAGQARLLPKYGNDPSETSLAAYEAGRRYTWISQYDRAVPLLRTASEAEGDLPLAGFYLAEALARLGWPINSPLPDEQLSRESEDTWTSWLEQVGPPDGSQAWVYVSGADIAERHIYFDLDKTEWVWRALLRAEKAIVLDPRTAIGWGICSRYLRRLQFAALPLEAAQQAVKLAPDVEEAKTELLALLANAGRFEEAMEILRGLPKADSDPWLIGVRGWVRLRIGESAESVADMTKALKGGFDPGWNLGVRVSGFIALGHVAEAIEDLRRIVVEDKDFGVVSAIRRARAHVLLGERAAAERELANIDVRDPLVDRTEYGINKVLVEACRGSADAAAQTLEEMLSFIRDQQQLDDISRSNREALAILESRAEDQRVLGILRAATDRLSAARPVVEVTADGELHKAMALHPDLATTAGACLVAIRARRRMAERDYREAADDYGRLREGQFEPEATSALVEALTRALSAAVSDGEPDLAAEFHRRLAVLGRSPYSSEEFAVAEASRVAGAPGKVHEALSRALAQAADGPSEFAASLRLGEAEVLAGDSDAGLALLEAALRAASSSDDAYGAAQSHARLAALLVHRGDSDRASDHLRAALDGFASAGRMNISTAVEIELREATLAMGLPPMSGTLAAAYDAVIHERDGANLTPDASS